MIPSMDSTKLKYIANCLMVVNKNAPAQLGMPIMVARDIWSISMLTIEDKNAAKVIYCDPYQTTAEALRRGLERFKGTITFAEDGRSHQIGEDVCVCHPQCKENVNIAGVIKLDYPLQASIRASTISVLTSNLKPKDDATVYLRNDSDGHYIGILDRIKVRMKGNIEPPTYTAFNISCLRKLNRMAKGNVDVGWQPNQGVIRFRWEAYGLIMTYYVAPRIINDEEIIKRLDKKVVL